MLCMDVHSLAYRDHVLELPLERFLALVRQIRLRWCHQSLESDMVRVPSKYSFT
jgi:hypothetical protein